MPVPVMISVFLPQSSDGPDALFSAAGDDRSYMYVPTESFIADQSFLFHLSEEYLPLIFRGFW